MHRTNLLPILTLLALAATGPVRAQITTRVDQLTTCNESNGASFNSSVSGDGRYVAYVSTASNLSLFDSNGTNDVYVLDRVTGSTTCASVNSSNHAGFGSSGPGVLSGDGRYVAFLSAATDLVPGDTNAKPDIFVRDLVAGTTVRVSVDSSGVQGNDISVHPWISADGRFVVFDSQSTNLVAGDTNGVSDVFLHDRDPDANGIFDEGNGTTIRVSVGPGGVQANGTGSGASVISADGRFIAFQSDATNLAAGDTNVFFDVYVYDRTTGLASRASVGPGAVQGNGNCLEPRISSDGRYVAFRSLATNFGVTDPNGSVQDIFVRDRSGGTTTCASVTPAGSTGNAGCTAAAISGDGRFVAFASTASDLVAGDTNGQSDVFVRDMLANNTRLLSAPAGGLVSDGASDVCAISTDGALVAYQSTATNLVFGDFNGLQDVFLTDDGFSTLLHTTFCFGDGTGGSCPCGNNGLAGRGCDNSEATGGAQLIVTGHTNPDTIEFQVTGERPGVTTIFLQGTTSFIPGTAFGDGLRCVGGNLKRLFVVNANPLGTAVLPRCPSERVTHLSALLGDPLSPGASRSYMTYYRDSSPTFCPIPTGNTWNASQAIGFTW